MTSQLDITWQRGETIAKYLFIIIIIYLYNRVYLFENLQTAWLKIIFRELILARYIRSLIYLWT